ncbi:heme peroxidase [Coprinopsis marcescibilis]|uniref:Heme peroxidase n=1 Tax=Coprinopsis marcescibilis TaxID=230819 RepID=A0A5C3KV58_COPMA|nr:heme peroxidase [Coprinopsis marcescibilis]
MSILRKFAQNIDLVRESRAPVDTDGARTQSGFHEKKLAGLHEMLAGSAFSVADLPAYLDAIRNAGGIGIDDRELLLEKVLVLMAKLKDTHFSKKLQEAAITLLYKDLPHPVSGYLRLPPTTAPGPAPPAVPYAFRTANGSYYNPLYPTMGMAGTPYARSVPSRHCLPKDSLPDPDLIFDTLLKREGGFTPHPGGMSALFFAFADLVIHSIFKTNPRDWTTNDASSYLDLSVLYGHNDRDVAAVRRNDGTGRLWPDVFADYRLTHMPPASCALLVLLSRNHNFVAQKILDINENGKYKKPSELDEKARQVQDDEIFHRTRLVNCGYFMHIILGGECTRHGVRFRLLIRIRSFADYVGAILGLVRDCSDWRLDPMMTMRGVGHDFIPVGEGNVVSTEFNLLYRWHATLSAEDTKWTEDVFKRMFDGKELKDININDFKTQAHKHLILNIDQVREWTFDGLERGADGQFSDDDLARIIQNSTEYRAGAFKARGIPEVMRIIEVMGIKQARTWGTCSLNEFRKFIGLKPYDSFKEWNPDPKIYDAAQALYRDIENLELHVGLQAEQTKEPTEGAGLCPGYTISRAILADAVCLVRGDRFFTSEYTPNNLTSWGYQDCQYDKEDGSFGGLLTKLLLRTLPQHYARGSAYAHFPFMVPSFLQNHWSTKQPELVGKYTWTRPRKQPNIVPVGSYEATKRAFTESTFISAANSRLIVITKSSSDKGTVRRTMTVRKRPVSQSPVAYSNLLKGREHINSVLSSSPKNLVAYFAKKTKDLINAKKFTSVDGKTHYVDIVQDVINLLPVHWISQQVAGLPLKSTSNPEGVWYEHDLYNRFVQIANYTYLNFHPEHDWALREASTTHGEQMIDYIVFHIENKNKNWVTNTFSLDARNHIGIEYTGSDILKKVVSGMKGEESITSREIAAQLFASVVPTAAIYSAALAQVVNFFLDEKNAEARQKVLALSASEEPGSSTELLAYVREALRLNPALPGFYRTASREVVLGSQNLQSFEVVYSSLVAANRDPDVFGAHADVPLYNRQGIEPILGFENTGLISEKFIAATVGPVLGAILSLKGIQRAKSNSGIFNGFQETWQSFPSNQYINVRGAVSPFPDSLIVEYQA